MHKQKIYLRNILQACVFCFALFLATPAFAAKKVQRVVNKGITDINQINFNPNASKIIIKGNQIENLEDFTIPDNFRIFAFNDNQISVINGLTLNTDLKKLVIFKNDITLIKKISINQSIDHINLGSNMINDVSNLDFSGTNLRRFSIVGNKISDLNGMILNDNLEEIFLDDNLIESIGQYVFPSGLKSLSLTFNKMESFNGELLPSNLETLELVGNNFNNYSDIKNLPQGLKQFSFGDVFMDEQDFTGLILPENLELLSLIVTPTTQEDLQTLVLPPGLIQLWLIRNSITSLDGLEFPNTLRVLDLRHNPISKKEQRRIIKRFKSENPKLKIRF